jgi:Secretion system C-terminal sorting domain
MKKLNTLAFIAFMFLILMVKSGVAIAAIADDSISITIICDMRDTTDLESYDPSVMYMTGSWTPPTAPGLTDWTFFTMDSIAPNIFRVSFKYAPGQFAGNEADDPDLLPDCPAWYFAPTDDWSTAEHVPAPCNVAWDIQRIFYINLDLMDTIVAFKYGICEPEPLNDLGLPEYSGIDEIQDQNLLLYPNPSNGLIVADISSFAPKANIEVFNISGKLVNKIENATGKVTIDMTGMPSSIYMVRISNGSKTINKKIVLNQ